MTFVSPCHLPMLPIYLAYLGGAEQNKRKTIVNSLGFIVGFSVLFIALGAFAGTIGHFLKQYETVINIVTGAVVILFGLSCLGVLKLHFHVHVPHKFENLRFLSSILFGVVIAISWMPCCTHTLGTALAIAGREGSMLQGTLLLALFSLGMAIPFFLSAMLFHAMNNAFEFIKKNYKIINIISGIFLIAIGLLMVTGYIEYFFEIFDWGH